MGMAELLQICCIKPSRRDYAWLDACNKAEGKLLQFINDIAVAHEKYLNHNLFLSQNARKRRVLARFADF